jgi:putative hydrolase of the HAD superfamily
MGRLAEREGKNMLFELETGKVSEPDFVAMLGAQLSEDLGRHIDLTEFSAHYFDGLEPNTPMLDEMAALRDAGYRMGLLTNNVREWEPRWRAMLPVDELFEVVVDSGFVGVRKPDRRIYEITCERLGVEPEECVFVDDFGHNCDAARELGMTAVWFRDTDQAVAELRDVIAKQGAFTA